MLLLNAPALGLNWQKAFVKDFSRPECDRPCLPTKLSVPLLFLHTMPTLLPSHEIASALQQLQIKGGTWAIDGKALANTWTFRNFQQAFNFMTLCAQSADRLNHHPDWANTYNRVSVRLTTHDAGGLTALDFQLAVAMQAIADKLLDTSSTFTDSTAQEADAHHLVQQWMAAFNQEQLQIISECYAQDALLWGTHGLQCIPGRDGVTHYFKQVFDSGRQVRVSLSGMQSWQAFDCHIAHGSYNFASFSDQGPKVLAARFSFVWRLTPGAWRLQSHHSSAMPLPA